MIRLVTIFALFLIAVPVTAQAQSSNNQFLDALNQANRIDPRQNPEYEPSDRILNRKMLDNKNKVVGEVRDLILNENGAVSALSVDFDRLRLGPQVFVNYRDMGIEPAGNGYMMNYGTSQIKDLYPEMLANIESASGGDDDSFSMKKLVGAPVKRTDGTRIAVVDKVLFGSEGSWAEALYVTMSGGTMRGRSIAIPYSMVEYRIVGNNREVIVTKDQADAIVDYINDDR